MVGIYHETARFSMTDSTIPGQISTDALKVLIRKPCSVRRLWGWGGLELAVRVTACVAPGKLLSLQPLLTKGRQCWNCCEPDKLRMEGGNGVGCC